MQELQNNIARTFAVYLDASCVSGAAVSAALNSCDRDWALHDAAKIAQENASKAHKEWRDAIEARDAARLAA